MERCLDCNSLLKKEEKVCWECGAAQKTHQSTATNSLASAVKLAFWGSFALLLVSPFVERAPSTMLCLLVTAALLFLSRTLQDGVQQVGRK
jgi:predicted amidophosphoribosyltransferase